MIVGVNGDTEPAQMRRARDHTGVSWRSFQDRRADGRTISEEWGVPSWPTFFLIDHKGVIHRRWTGGVGDEALESEIVPLIEAATREK